jgi:TRAP-type C4-dicarboxylate transport system permease small subunit
VSEARVERGAPKYVPWVERILRAMNAVEAGLGAVLILMILVLVMIQVVARFTPFGGWPWTGEFARFGLVWVAFGLIGYLVGRRQHVALDVIGHVLSPRASRISLLVADVIVMLTCAVFVRDGLALIDAQSGTRTSATGISMSLVYVLPVAGFLLALLRIALDLLPKGRR